MKLIQPLFAPCNSFDVTTDKIFRWMNLAAPTGKNGAMKSCFVVGTANISTPGDPRVRVFFDCCTN